jgi:hypothetical protein
MTNSFFLSIRDGQSSTLKNMSVKCTVSNIPRLKNMSRFLTFLVWTYVIERIFLRTKCSRFLPEKDFRAFNFIAFDIFLNPPQIRKPAHLAHQIRKFVRLVENEWTTSYSIVTASLYERRRFQSVKLLLSHR